MLSTDKPIGCTLRFSNSGARRENSMNSVVQTGVKSAGWEKSNTHFPALVYCERVISPCVLMALKSGAASLMRGIGCRSCASMIRRLLLEQIAIIVCELTRAFLLHREEN